MGILGLGLDDRGFPNMAFNGMLWVVLLLPAAAVSVYGFVKGDAEGLMFVKGDADYRKDLVLYAPRAGRTPFAAEGGGAVG